MYISQLSNFHLCCWYLQVGQFSYRLQRNTRGLDSAAKAWETAIWSLSSCTRWVRQPGRRVITDHDMSHVTWPTDPPNFWNVENELRHCNCTTHQASSVQWSCGAVVPISIIMFASGCRGGGAEASIHRPGESETRIHNNRTSTWEWEMPGKLNTFGNFSALIFVI